MHQRHSRSRLWVVTFLGFLALCEAAASHEPKAQEPEIRAESDAYRIALVESREVPYTLVKGVIVQQHELRATDKASGKSLLILFGGPEKPVSGEIRDLRIFEDRLVATTHTALAVFDLRSGHEERLVSCHDPAISETARWVAYKVFQPRFTPPEASTNVVVVLDISSLESTTVFPERQKISSGPRGELLAWEEDPAQRTSVGKLFWGPREERLLFFGKRWRNGEQGRQAVDSLVMVDLAKGIKEATFSQQEIAPEVYMKPGVTVSDSRVLFNVSEVHWLDSEALEIIPPVGYWWMKDRITIDVKALPEAGTKNG